MANRTFGWVQNPSSTETLKNIVSLFVPESEFHKFMVEKRLPLLASADLFASKDLYLTFQNILRKKKTAIPYDILKGQGAMGESRAKAKCSGLAQAAVTGQQYKEYLIEGDTIKIKKPYTDDWTADGFLRWAISLGFLDYDYSRDSCSITQLGIKFAKSESHEETQDILGYAYLSYPPVCRILGLLEQYGHLTKFELGAKLGFTDEEGFTSFPQNIWVQAYEESTDADVKRNMRSDTEGSSDKYARMICGWLKDIGWVDKHPKTVTATLGGKTYKCEISSAFKLTSSGLTNYRRAIGKSNDKRIPKIVYREMLASKAPNASYLRKRRATILECLGKHKFESMNEIQAYLNRSGITEDTAVIKDDISGLINIGLDIEINEGKYRLNDNIIKLVPYSDTITKETTESSVVKERARLRLQHIDHKYLVLIDYAFSGRDNCTDFEIHTIDLFVNELKYHGVHLGGSRKPDGIVYDNSYGIIIDNKAYSKGFTITRHMADEMTRYVQENNDRNESRNPTQWWLNFGESVNHFNYVFISSLFKGDINHMLHNIKESSGVDGCVLTVENLLYFADTVKGGSLGKEDFLKGMGINRELKFSND